MSEAFIYDHVRTPRGKGKKDGSLHQASPVWLLRTLLQATAPQASHHPLTDPMTDATPSPVGDHSQAPTPDNTGTPPGWPATA